MLGTVYSAGILGFEATLVKVEVDVSGGLPGWQMVGLPEKSVQESKERVSGALRNSGLRLEARKTTINMAPATYKKTGNQYDLPIAVGMLVAHQAISQNNLSSFLFVGELSLTGELKPIHGPLLFADLAKQKGLKILILPKINAPEAGLIKNIQIIGCETIAEVFDFLNSGKMPESAALQKTAPPLQQYLPDFSEVKGQLLAKRALEIAAAGNHHLIMMGPPGTGKTLLASRLPSILPPLTPAESLESTKIYSAFGLNDVSKPLITDSPFRSPHHSTSYAALIGGGKDFLYPGEITLAHNGVLFLDELPEFHRDVLQMLRQPLEAGHVCLTRSKSRMKFPASFQLIAAMNPCRCGYLGHPKRHCICAPGSILQYRHKISGPLLDRIDLQIEMAPLNEEDLFGNLPTESSAQIRERVMTTRKRQQERYAELDFSCNAQLTHKDLKEFCPLTPEAEKFFRKIFPTLNLSARAHDRILKVSRTIADLDGKEIIETEQIAEAVQYRALDRENIF
ncbi:MAG: YifB family Mg chelatase-like AAA ATPase [Deltaproteobacteria bacterium]|nr:YifB family Mg chelatase-like AAA ATPase [Deltaproteobacteria bacterium]